VTGEHTVNLRRTDYAEILRKDLRRYVKKVFWRGCSSVVEQ
jgi:hypothetical protein